MLLSGTRGVLRRCLSAATLGAVLLFQIAPAAAQGGRFITLVVPFAAGGPSSVENLQLRCRAHNAYEASRDFGEWRLQAPSGRS